MNATHKIKMSIFNYVMCQFCFQNLQQKDKISSVSCQRQRQSTLKRKLGIAPDMFSFVVICWNQMILLIAELSSITFIRALCRR